MYVKFVILKSF